MKKFFTNVKDWFIAHKPTKRRLIQLYAALLTNANLTGFATGKIYTGDTKKMCVPGLNCYSCPGAVGACPMGALQDSLANSGRSAPSYIFGILILFGLLLGRVICGFLCPFGLIQELLYKVRTPKLRKSRFTRIFSYFKYVLLVIVTAIPLIFAGIPSFCKYVCPAGTLEGAISLLANPANANLFEMLGALFSWKFCILVAVIVLSIFIYRFFCRFICPLGAIYSLFCGFSLLGVKLDKNKCIDCGLCIQGCKMDIKHVGDHECIQCGECIPVCPVQAISWKGSQIFVKNTSPLAQPVVEGGEKVALLEIAKTNARLTVTEPDQNSPVANASDTEGAEIQDGAVKEVAAKEAPQETEVTSEVKTAENAEIAVSEGEGGKTKATSGGKLAAVKTAFKSPRFVVEFVAWVVALALLLAAFLAYGLRGRKDVMVYGEGDKCPLFELEVYDTASGATQFSTLASRGKVTVINYWYTLCDPCKEELPEFERVYEDYNGEINMVVIHSWSALVDGTEGVQSFLDTEKDANGRVWGTYELTFAQDTEELDTYAQFGGNNEYPRTIVVNADGVISTIVTGKCPEATLRTAIEKAKG